MPSVLCALLHVGGCSTQVLEKHTGHIVAGHRLPNKCSTPLVGPAPRACFALALCPLWAYCACKRIAGAQQLHHRHIGSAQYAHGTHILGYVADCAPVACLLCAHSVLALRLECTECPRTVRCACCAACQSCTCCALPALTARVLDVSDSLRHDCWGLLRTVQGHSGQQGRGLCRVAGGWRAFGAHCVRTTRPLDARNTPIQRASTALDESRLPLSFLCDSLTPKALRTTPTIRRSGLTSKGAPQSGRRPRCPREWESPVRPRTAGSRTPAIEVLLGPSSGR